MKYGLIFDVDGTLWDTSQIITDSWNSTLNTLGVKHLPFDNDLCISMMGKTMDEWAEMLLPDLDSDLRKKVVDTCITNETAVLKKQGGILYPGLVETFKQLHSLYHLSILSNCGLGYIDTLIDYAKIRPYVDYQLCFGDNNLDKADNIPLLIQKNSLDKAVYIGDTDKDYQACLTANIPFIYATYGFGQVDNTRWTIDSLDQLPKVAAQVFALD